MIATEKNKERAMEMLTVLTVEDLARRSGEDLQETYRKFRRSKTFGILFDEETGLWENGPAYIADEYLLTH